MKGTYEAMLDVTKHVIVANDLEANDLEANETCLYISPPSVMESRVAIAVSNSEYIFGRSYRTLFLMTEKQFSIGFNSGVYETVYIGVIPHSLMYSTVFFTQLLRCDPDLSVVKGLCRSMIGAKISFRYNIAFTNSIRR